MADQNSLSASFQDSRQHLHAVAYRMLGSLSEAEDAVQETWIRVSRADTSDVQNLRGWLTTAVARVCLDMLRARKAHREDAVGTEPPETASKTDAEQEAALADSVGLALLVVLETLDPAERLAFVLHDVFGASFDEIAEIIGRSAVAARQLASRARRRVRGAPSVDEAELARQREAVGAFLMALRSGDVDQLVSVLDPEVVVRTELPSGGPREIRGARTWAKQAAAYQRARGAGQLDAVRMALVDGIVGIILAPAGRLTRVLRLTFDEARIVRVDIVSNPERLRELTISVLD
ncbi:sigma-70 family RNA polymerase sigma factor [Sorangium sp. So ce260]|uniref:sigma-70 family RNA polymerase sigma factor n=1 Tax=Sorangium sp. So ce260 TaxID=3133291 RepID=UPI003F5DA74C